MEQLVVMALGLSLVANAVLGILLYRLSHTRRGKPLPRQKPDFVAVEKELMRILAEPDLAALAEVDKFETKEWICRVVLLHKVNNIAPHWDKVVQIVRRVSEACKIPGRPAGWHPDPEDSQRMIGTTVEFGYSPEVGYNHPNEFYQERRKRKTEPTAP